MKSSPAAVPAQDHFYWMRQALTQAEKSAKKGEVPIGAVAVLQGRRVASGHNLSITRRDPSAHAEIVCLRRAAVRLKNYRLSDIILYVTVEPCLMCAGAMIWARIGKVVFGCRDAKAGACGSVVDLAKIRAFNHRFEVQGGVLEQESRDLMRKFFKKRR